MKAVSIPILRVDPESHGTNDSLLQRRESLTSFVKRTVSAQIDCDHPAFRHQREIDYH